MDAGEGGAGGSWTSRVAVGDALLALALIGYGAYLMVGAGAIRVLPVYSRIGPRFFPYLVAGAALLCGVLLLIEALRGRRAPPEAGEDVDLLARDNLRPVLVIVAGLALGAALMEPAGFVLAATLIFASVALAFGSRSIVRDLGIGLALSLVAYLSFTRLLDLTLPAGILPL
ncbi:MAG TPA: tripartite tricarboxylate transporter TctB family protein [Trueperaceae bacterium]|nr:tripartite tricarboxylate transporter TctB family protein [Trueperaceae bacterium]